MQKVKVWTFKIFGFLFLLIGFLTFLFFQKYRGSLILYPTLWSFAGILLLIIGFLFLKNGFFSNDLKAIKDWENERERFILAADKIKVNLEDCEIKSNNYIEEVERVRSYRLNALDAMYDASKNLEQININKTVLIFETDHYGQREYFYSSIIDKDELTLKFLIERQKVTYIYMDKTDRSIYYFDLEFLYN